MSNIQTQLGRFGRLFVVTLVPQLIALGASNWTRSAIISAVVGALEVVYRQAFPAVPVKVV